VLGCERRPVSASIMSRSCFASFPVCVYKFSSHYLNNIIIYRQYFGASSDRITLYIAMGNVVYKLKLRPKNTIIGKTLTYASETRKLRNRDRKQMNIFEREVYRRIFRPSV